MNTTKKGILPLSISLSTQGKKAHVFDGLHSESIISLGKLCDDACIAILDKNEINIHRNKIYGLWDIPISRLLIHCAHEIITRDKINHQKDNISYVPLDPVADYVYIAYLILELRVG